MIVSDFEVFDYLIHLFLSWKGFLLEKGVHVNVDSLQELDVITEVIKEVKYVTLP